MKGSSLWKSGLVILAVLFLSLLTANTEQASANSALDSMIDIRSDDGEYDSAEAQAMIDRLRRVDDRILQHTNSAGVSIILMDMPLTELPEFDYLSGKVPRGWENTNSTWDEVPGAGGHTTAARIGYSDPGNGHSTINLELHEYGHAVDSYAAGFTVSGSDEFRQIMNSEKDALFGDHKVSEYFDEPGEYFAEVFAMYYMGGDAQSKLQNRAPETYEFISHFHNRLVTVDEVTGNTAKISWDEMDGAAKYEIYRNDEKIDETAETSFTDEELKTSTNYNYYIRPVDSSGNRLLTSYFRTTTTQSEEDAPEVDTAELESVIEDAEAVSEADRSPGLQSALENARSIVGSDEAGQQQADEAETALSSALEENRKELKAAEEESAEESTEEDTTEESTEEETEESAEEETEEETEAESETGSSQAEASNDNMFMILLSSVLVILAIISAILIWKRKK
ncbi:anthrax toxin lethal factor-related metalloendopeptidase [Salinicoccus carnicancri]|uniref:anthrax toxin lethal factor-related metalloendopeptidase n=1 Tax=Salinicoccus carnicancri TaxID=558170 RepID=UPI0002E14DDF|nr:hypothetical protein [Salinicoccus carnicancri]